MERFVFIAAVTFAIIFAIVAVLGRGNFGIHIGMDAGGMAPVVATAPGRMEAQTFEGSELRVKHAAAHIIITPEDRQDYLIEIDNPGRAPMPAVSSDDGLVIIDGQLRGRVGDCHEGGGAELRGYGDFALPDLPQITIHAPRELKLDLSGGSTTEVGPAQSVDMEFAGCGAAQLADVTEDLSVDLMGSGHIRTAAARRLNADVAGSGTLATGAIAEAASVDMAGSGNVTIASLNGSLSTDGAGSGSISVQGGALTDAKVELAGSGQVDIAAPVRQLEVSILGSGDVDVQGVVGDLTAEVAGSGRVSARSVTGTVHREILGSGQVEIGSGESPQQGAQNAP